MRAGIHGAGIAIERVLNPTIAPARRFHGVVDTVFTIALGSVCAFALTLGPAPLNTVAASSAASATFDSVETSPAASPLLPNQVTTTGSGAGQQQADEQRITENSAPSQAATPAADAVSQSPSAPPAAAPALPAPTPSLPAPTPSLPAPAMPNGLPQAALPAQASAALTIVENYRTASGLARFVDSCAAPAVHAEVLVTPSGVFPEGLAKKSLAPDPAQARVQDNGNGSVSVTVYSCL